MGLFAALTAQERHTLAAMLFSASHELIEEKMRLRRNADAISRGLYGTDAEAYVGAIDDVHRVLGDLLMVPAPGCICGRVDGSDYCPVHNARIVPTGTGWPVAS